MGEKDAKKREVLRFTSKKKEKSLSNASDEKKREAKTTKNEKGDLTEKGDSLVEKVDPSSGSLECRKNEGKKKTGENFPERVAVFREEKKKR